MVFCGFLRFRSGAGLAVWLAVALALPLVGCGGGGTSGGTTTPGSAGEMSLLEQWQRFEAGNPTLRLTRAQVLEAYDSTSRAASHVLYWDLAFSPDGEEPIDLYVETYEHEDLELPPEIDLVPVLEYHGVRLAEVSGRVQYEDEFYGETVAWLSDETLYLGWLDHTVFGAAFFADCEVGAPGCSGARPAYTTAEAGGWPPSGAYPGTTPAGTGSATWTGVMVGMESLGSSYADSEPATVPAWVEAPDVYLGDARIRIEDLAVPDVDVSFTEIHNVTEGAPHPDMRWEGLAVEDGLFGGGGLDEFISGMFTGPRHQEVGGQFARDGIAGGFGARQR